MPRKSEIVPRGNAELDETDRRILRVFQRDTMLSYKQLGAALHLPPSSVFDRIKRMKKSGIIKATVPLLDTKALNLNTTAWMFIKAGPACDEVAARLAKDRDILEVHEVAGEYDLLLKVKAKNNEDYHDMSVRILTDPGVRESFSTLRSAR